MDEKLKTTIDRIVQLSKQNPEFDLELRKVLNINSTPTSLQSSSDKRIENIENYLGLDYYVDNQPPLIDFSFIQENDVRNQLISDNREMMRFRYGTRYHSICFNEFCRYAHLQAEMLLNYYYDKKNDSIDAVISHIKKFNPTAKFKDNVKNIGEISYNTKLWAVKKEFDIDYKIYTVLEYLRRIRNESSHRSPENEENSILNYKKILLNMGMPLKSDGDIDFYKLEEGSTEMNLYNNVVNNKAEYKEYKYLIWLHIQSFDKVINTLERLKQIIREHCL